MADSDSEKKFSQLTPEQQNALLDYAYRLPASSDIVKQQLARAKALREKMQVPMYGWQGPLFNGLGNAINEGIAGYQEAKAQKEQREIADKMAKALQKGSPWQQRPAAAEEPPDVEYSAPLPAGPSAPPASPSAVTSEWGMDLTGTPAPKAAPGATARAAGRLAGLSPERIDAALGPDFPGTIPWGL